ncbi:MAG TPA: STT3 domain-containing protein, partial [Anaeromyxobacteraceae bacterium]|nr:STT3 domain-containing protein [Anaeromyxobacteraceae bacterium]
MHRADSSRRAGAGGAPGLEGEAAGRARAPDRRRALLALAAVLALALGLRLAPFGRIFTPGGVALAADGDTWYHALRAERIARDWPRVPWTDPGMNHPAGAEIPWPPLLDQAVATLAVATGPATPEHVRAVAALVPPVLGAAVVALAALLGAALLGGAAWWDAALLVALLPAAIRQSFVGRPDHHVLEVLLAGAALLAYAREIGRERAGRLGPALLGAVLALSFWSWSGSALTLLFLAAHAALLHVLSPPGDPAPARAARTLALGGLAAALLLAITVGALGPPGALRSLRLTPITGLSAALCALTALGAGALLAARRLDAAAGPLRRAAHLAA